MAKNVCVRFGSVGLLIALIALTNRATDAVTPRTGVGHVKYYGFYGQGRLTNKLIAKSANIAFVGEEELDHIDTNARHGIASIVVAQQLFFGDGAFNHIPLRDDAPTKWRAFATRFAPKVHKGLIAAFYLYDEPYSNQASLGIPKTQTYNELRTAAAIIKDTFPGTTVMVVEQYAYLEPFMTDAAGKQTLFPSEIDWVGFDCYRDTFETCGGKGISFFFNQVKAGLHPNQRIVLVPQIFAYGKRPTVADQQYVINLGRKYVTLARSSPEVVAVIPFIASNYQEPSNDTPFWGGLEPTWGRLKNDRVRNSLLENGRILLGWQTRSRQPLNPKIKRK